MQVLPGIPRWPCWPCWSCAGLGAGRAASASLRAGTAAGPRRLRQRVREPSVWRGARSD